MSGSSLITLRARLADGASFLLLNGTPALLLSLLFALSNLILIKLFVLLEPGIGEYLADRSRRQDHLAAILLMQTIALMVLVGHGLIWARICLLGRTNALAGGMEGFFRRFSTCLTRLMVAALLGIALSLPALIFAIILTGLLRNFGGFGQSMASAASIMLLAVPLGAVVSALILSMSAEAIDRRLSMLAAMQQTQPAWIRLAVVMIVLVAIYILLAVGLSQLAGAETRLPGSVFETFAFLLQHALGFLTLALAIGALAPLLRDRKKSN
ncbi:MAG: hypothetical protein ACFB22_08520 [Rhodothalassiaceae bacterium]